MRNTPGGGAHPLDPLPDIQQLPQAVLEKLAGWRDKWAEIWVVRLERRFWVFRSPTRGEAIDHDLNAMTTEAKAQESFVKKCLLYPEGELPESLEAFFGLYNAIWTASGFRNPLAFQERLAEFEELIYQPEQAYIATILRAFPRYGIEDINSWQPEKIIYVLAMARMLLGLEPISMQKPRRRPRDVSISDREPLVEPLPDQVAAPPAKTQTRPDERRRAAARGAVDWEAERAEWDAFTR